MIIFFVGVLVIPLMLIFAGLTVDLGAFGVLRDKLQRAADSAATAGASAVTWQKTDPACSTNCSGVWTLNEDVSRAYSSLNGYTPASVSFDPAVPSVFVSVASVMDTSFLRLIGITSLASAAQAKAVRSNIDEPERSKPGRSRLTQ